MEVPLKVELSDLPEGSLTRYYRDVHRMSGSNLPFDQFLMESLDRRDEFLKKEDVDHPVQMDKTFRIAGHEAQTIHVFKRKGRPISCHMVDMAQNGGSGDIPLEEALSLIGDPGLAGEIDSLG